VLAQFPVRQRVLSARLALILIASSIPPVSVVRHRVACVALYKSPFYVVVVPCVIKKSQESDEDKASKRGVHQVRDKKLGHSAWLKFNSSKLFNRGKDLQQLITEEKKAPRWRQPEIVVVLAIIVSN
jgi:hypothetical protein